MKGSILTLTWIVSLLIAGHGFAQECFPKTSKTYPVQAGFQTRMSTTAISEQQFAAVLEKVENYFKPLFSKKKLDLTVTGHWENPTVNAFARQIGRMASVDVYGGLARHPKINADALNVVLCHEVGHHLGGAPKNRSLSWASVEGQSDYYSTLKCMRALMQDEFTAQPQLVQKWAEAAKGLACEQVFREDLDLAMCARSARAGETLGAVLADITGEATPSLDTPSSTIVDKINYSYPSAQCRVDTYANGSLCNRPFSEDMSNTEFGPGSCLSSAGYKWGSRPSCWFIEI